MPGAKNSTFSRANLGPFLKFSVVGASGVLVNEGLLLAFQSAGVFLLYASVAAIEVSILTNFVLNDLWTFKDRRSGAFVVRLAKFNALMLVGLVVNAAVVDVGTLYFGVAAAITNLVGIGVAFILRYTLSVKYAWMRTEDIRGQAAPPAPMASPMPTEA